MPINTVYIKIMYNYCSRSYLSPLDMFSGAMKNAIDWASMDPNVCKDKPAALMSAGYELGGGLAQYSMRQMGVRLDMHFINVPQLFVFIQQPPPKFDKEGNLIDDGTRKQIKTLLLSLRAFTLRLRD